MELLKSRKAQAMTEFVIIIPVLILLFVGIYQFALVMISWIKLAMVEREVMMFLTEEDNEKNFREEHWTQFGQEMAKKVGLEGQVEIEPYKASNNEEGNDKSPMGDSKIGILNTFTGMDFVISYEHKLLPYFSFITGRDSIKLKTRLVTATGGCFVIKLKKGLDEAFKYIGDLMGGKDENSYEDNMKSEEGKWRLQNKSGKETTE